MGALNGIRVLDLSRILAGPWATQMLADVGAEVIKVERPGRGDDTRQWGPPWMTDINGETQADAAYFHSVNRNKRSIAIDITTSEGQALLKQLAQKSDVLVENFKVGGLAQYGLDYDSLQAINPALIYCSITGFGQTGPLAEQAGYDFMIQGMGGLMSVTGEPDGPPQKAGVALVDIITGLYACNAIQTALLARPQTGVGQHIDLALLDCQVATLANQAMNYLATGTSPTRLGNAHPNIVPYQVFAAVDGHIILAIGNDEQFARFCTLVKHPELAQDLRFNSNPARVKNREILIPKIAAVIARQDTDYWLRELAHIKVPCGPINTVEEVFAEPQVQARHLAITIKDDHSQSFASVASPLNFSSTPIDQFNASPRLGQDTLSVLTDLLHVSDQQIDHLINNGVIAGEPH